MADLQTMLGAPIRWRDSATNDDVRSFLVDLQANILKGHGRHHAAFIFMAFPLDQPDKAAEIVRALGQYCTSAATQLRSNKRYPPHLDGGKVRCLFLSASGYRALGSHVATPVAPDESAFALGMAARQDVLSDPPRNAWGTDWRDTAPDAMFLIADSDPASIKQEVEAVVEWLHHSHAAVLNTEIGLQQTRQFRSDGPAEGVEHFGYVDGRSQPLFLVEDIEEETKSVDGEPGNDFSSGRERWDFVFPPSQFIVADPNGQFDLSAGSFFVFRKLEQNVREFNAAEEELAKTLFPNGPTQDEADRAGAMVVGRYEDGTPLTDYPDEQNASVPNGFTYEEDPEGLRCPFHAHIRKTNPRGDVQRELNLPDRTGDRSPIMARRGITYGPPRPMTSERRDFADEGVEPAHGSGLLFMAYMQSLEDQFEFTQQTWANNPAFVGNIAGKPRPSTGIDPVIGQFATATAVVPGDGGSLIDVQEHTWQDGHTEGSVPIKAGFESFVTMKGGEYFFAPSISFLRSVGLNPVAQEEPIPAETTPDEPGNYTQPADQLVSV